MINIDEIARQKTSEVLELVLRQGSPATIVDSPPGAGKTRLIEDVSAAAVGVAGLRVAVVAPRAEQTYSFLRRFTASFGPARVQLLQSKDRETPADLAMRLGDGAVVNSPGDLAPGPGLVVGTVEKFVFSSPKLGAGAFDLLICDEAYQVPAKSFAPLFEIAGQTLLVGDPGQLPPLVRVETAGFEAAVYRIHWPTPKELLSRIPDVPVVQLPASRRLPPDTAELIQPGFYPQLPFVSAAHNEERRISFSGRGSGDAIDKALGLLARGATVVSLVLPERDLPGDGVDEEVSEVMAEVVARSLARGITWEGRGILGPADIGCSDPHVASGAAVRRGLQQRGLSPDEVMVDTPEIWQGLERPLMVVKHPLSGRRRLDAFVLEPGRWCVMLSRHLLGCVIVTRGGIDRALAGHSHDCASRPLGGENFEWSGWRAHTSLWDQMRSAGRTVAVSAFPSDNIYLQGGR